MLKKITVTLEDKTVELYLRENRVGQFMEKIEKNRETDTFITFRNQIEAGFFLPSKIVDISIEDFEVADVDETETK